MAKDFLAIMTTSAPIESQFSIFGNIITKNRNNVSTKTAIMTILLKNWNIPEKTVNKLELESNSESDNSDNGEDVILFN